MTPEVKKRMDTLGRLETKLITFFVGVIAAVISARSAGHRAGLAGARCRIAGVWEPVAGRDFFNGH